MSILISLIVAIVVFAVLWYTTMWLLAELGAPTPVVKIVRILFALVAFLWVVGTLTGYVPAIHYGA